MKLSELKVNPNNPQVFTDEALEKLTNSLKDFPKMLKLRPLVYDPKTMYVLGGNKRLLALQKLGFKEIPDEWVQSADELTEEEKQRFIVQDNIQAGDWDWERLQEWDADDLEEWGLDVQFEEEPKQGLTDDDAIPDEVEPVCKPGDLWQLGEHRLLCGDATKKEDVERLMGGEKADMVFTDPPYNVDYEGYTKEKLTIKSDAMSDEDYYHFLFNSFSAVRNNIKDTAGLYICHASAWQLKTETVLNELGIVMRNQIIWAKNTFAWGMGRYKFQHEPIFYAHIDGKSDNWYGDRSQSTLWMENKPVANKLHPTMKPVEIVIRAINNSSKKEDIILDTFLGSGSTLIAAEKTNRKCYGMEIDPHYCDVIIKRWEDFTGKKAIKTTT